MLFLFCTNVLPTHFFNICIVYTLCTCIMNFKTHTVLRKVDNEVFVDKTEQISTRILFVLSGYFTCNSNVTSYVLTQEFLQHLFYKTLKYYYGRTIFNIFRFSFVLLFPYFLMASLSIISLDEHMKERRKVVLHVGISTKCVPTTIYS